MRGHGDFSIGSQVWPGTSKIMEEASELITVLSKLQATNGELAYWEGDPLDIRMEDEIADVLAAIEFFLQENGDELDLRRMRARTSDKLKLFRKWHLEQQG
jgi:NTP pyrophosphatase (non-canonical NTP hydrolase)